MFGFICLVIGVAAAYLFIGFCVYVTLVHVWYKNWNQQSIVRFVAAILFPIIFFRTRNGRGVRSKKELHLSSKGTTTLALTILFWPIRLVLGSALALVGVMLPKPIENAPETITANVQVAIRSCRRALQRSSSADERARLTRTIELLEAVLDPKKRLRLIRSPTQASDDTKPSA